MRCSDDLPPPVQKREAKWCNRRLVSRLKFAGLRQDAAIEDLDTKAVRGLDKALFAKLAAGDWIANYKKLFVDTVDRLSMISLTGRTYEREIEKFEKSACGM
jgi:hypothetical protein